MDGNRRSGLHRLLVGARRALVVALTITMVTSQVPAAAWAEGASEVASAAASAASALSSADAGADSVAGAVSMVPSASDDNESAALDAESTTDSQTRHAAFDDGSGASQEESEHSSVTDDELDSDGADENESIVSDDTSRSSESAQRNVSEEEPGAHTAYPNDATADAVGLTSDGEAEAPADGAENTADSREAEPISVTGTIVGRDSEGEAQTWLSTRSFSYEEGAFSSVPTVTDVVASMRDAAGISSDEVYTDSEGVWINGITSPLDSEIYLEQGMWSEDGNDGQSFWHLYVNGTEIDWAGNNSEYESTNTNDIALSSGDAVVLSYGPDGDEVPSTEDIVSTIALIGRNAEGRGQTWVTDTALSLPAGSTAADLTVLLVERMGLTAEIYTPETHGYWMLNAVTSPFDSSLSLSYEQATWSYWQLFINGELAQVGADSYVLQPDDTVTWCYGSDGVLPGAVRSTIEVIGLDGQGNIQRWLTPVEATAVDGATALDVTQSVFADKGFAYRCEDGVPVSIDSPFEEGLALSNDGTRSWRLFINGESVEADADAEALSSGDAIVWYYAADDASLPDGDNVVIDPGAVPPADWEAAWGQFANGGHAVSLPTPTEAVGDAWTYRYGEPRTSVSDPLVVNGRIYLVSDGWLSMLDASTGQLLKQTNAGGSFSYFCRPVYANGLIVLATDDGCLSAFTADDLTCMWRTGKRTPEDGGRYQSNSTLSVNGGYVYAGFTVIGAGGIGTASLLLCVRISDGSVKWERTADASSSGSAEGYYWTGAVASGDDIITGDEAGRVQLRDGATGELLSSVSLGSMIRTSIVALDENAYLVASYDGVLHRIERVGNDLREKGSVAFATKCTSSPTVAGSHAFVGGLGADEATGILAVIDLASMTVERTVLAGAGEVQSAPLVSVQADGTFVYFTCNAYPGGLYCYRLGDENAAMIFTPADEMQQYCTATVVADAEGNLYYTNDAGLLFKLSAREGFRVNFEVNGGSHVPAQWVAAGGTVEVPAEPTREGYAFGGWYADAELTQAWDFNMPVTAAMTLYAKWVKKDGGVDPAPVPPAAETITVTFDTRGGSAIDAVEVEKGHAVARPDDPAREGYTFAGWFSGEACSEAFAWDFDTPVTSDLTLYAKWTKNVSPSTGAGTSTGGSQSDSKKDDAAKNKAGADDSATGGAAVPGKKSLANAEDAADGDTAEVAALSAEGVEPRTGARAAATRGTVDVAAAVPWLPLAGVTVGVAGLAAVALWWRHDRRKGF